MALVSVKQAAVSELFSDPFEFRDRLTDFTCRFWTVFFWVFVNPSWSPGITVIENNSPNESLGFLFSLTSVKMISDQIRGDDFNEFNKK